MSKFWKNFLYISITLIVIFVMTYAIGSCSMVFNSYKVKRYLYQDIYFASSDVHYVYFVYETEARLFKDGDLINCDVEFSDRFINLSNEEAKIKYQFFILNDDVLYYQKKNSYFKKVVVSYEN